MEQLLKFHHSHITQNNDFTKNGIYKNNTIYCLIYSEYVIILKYYVTSNFYLKNRR
jgi:hypothetical protein